MLCNSDWLFSSTTGGKRRTARVLQLQHELLSSLSSRSKLQSTEQAAIHFGKQKGFPANRLHGWAAQGWGWAGGDFQRARTKPVAIYQPEKAGNVLEPNRQL